MHDYLTDTDTNQSLGLLQSIRRNPSYGIRKRRIGKEEEDKAVKRKRLVKHDLL